MNFTFQCQVILEPKFELAQAHEPGNMLSRVGSLGMPSMAIPSSMLAVTTLIQTRVMPIPHTGSPHTGAHIFAPQTIHSHSHSTIIHAYLTAICFAHNMHIDPATIHKSLHTYAQSILPSHTSSASQHIQTEPPIPRHFHNYNNGLTLGDMVFSEKSTPWGCAM